MIQFEAYIFLNKLWADKKPPEKGVQVVRSVQTWDLLAQLNIAKISLLRKDDESRQFIVSDQPAEVTPNLQMVV